MVHPHRFEPDPGNGLSAGADAHSGSSGVGWADMGIDPFRQSFLLTGTVFKTDWMRI
ncbi:MAG: hypothetical protein IKB09_07360 [Oscillospiraceae bacterium]|nr:hypothetical protein [Oscillospiraceae bacterium]